MPGLWRYRDGKGKFLVQRRDGSVPEWPYLVLGAPDQAAVSGVLAYASAAEQLGYDPEYVRDVRKLASEFAVYLHQHGPGDPDAPPHREEDPEIMAKLEGVRGA